MKQRSNLCKLITGMFVLLLCLGGVAEGASFDCGKSGTAAEKMICGDAELSKLDEELGKAYTEAIKKAPDPVALKEQQLAWLKERNSCMDVSCMKDQYQLRIGELNRVVSLSTESGAQSAAVHGDRYTNSLGMEFVYIGPGSFMMGSPTSEEGRGDSETQHRVTLSEGYWMQTTEVTQAQWEAVMGSNPSAWRGDNSPVEKVSWYDVQEFICKLNKRGDKITYNLPTEAQWEYAARAGSSTRFCFGESDSQLENYAWYPSNSSGKTHAVRQKQPNPWGLYDMYGNVAEWCQDWYDEAYPTEAATDPTGPSSGSSRVERGGDWHDDARYCRSASRSGRAPFRRDGTIGFRLASPQANVLAGFDCCAKSPAECPNGECPSFDCAEATLPVEQMICVDEELSHLDVMLNQVYDLVLKQAKNPEQLKKQQLKWLRLRNSLPNRSDVLISYKNRFLELHALIPVGDVNTANSRNFFPESLSHDTTAIRHRYVPESHGISFYTNPDFPKDYFVSYLDDSPERHMTGFYFFSGLRIPRLDRSFYEKSEELPTGLSETLASGAKIKLKSLDGRMIKRCPQALNAYYEITGADGTVSRKSILYILDEPRITEISDRCVDTSDSSVREFVIALSGCITPIPDGGFFLNNQTTGLVARFDESFKTDTEILGKKLFVMDTDDLDDIMVHEGEMYNYSQSQLSVYKYLTKKLHAEDKQ